MINQIGAFMLAIGTALIIIGLMSLGAYFIGMLIYAFTGIDILGVKDRCKEDGPRIQYKV